MKKNKKNRIKALAVMSVFMLLIAAFAVQSAFGETCYCSINCPTWDECDLWGAKCTPQGQTAIGGEAETGVFNMGGACQIIRIGVLTWCPMLGGSCGTRADVNPCPD